METGIYYAVVFHGQTAKLRALYSIDEVSVLDGRVKYVNQQAYWYDSRESATAGYAELEGSKKSLFPYSLNLDPVSTRDGQRISNLRGKGRELNENLYNS